MSAFDDRFFVLDSENLPSVRTRLYGYAVTEDGIFEDDNRGDRSFEGGCGCYVFVKAGSADIRITQDDNGSVGLYLFEREGYFAVGNSFFTLLDHVRQRFRVSANLDYMRHFAAIGLCSNAYGETAVNEIRRVDRKTEIVIDRATRRVEEICHALPLRTVRIDSAEGFRILDRWYARWTGLFRGLYAATNGIQLDLSGGMDSRLCFMLAAGAGVDFSDILVYSCRPADTKHQDEYGIAEQIGREYGFRPNDHAFRSEVEDFSLGEAVDLAYRVKMTFHKKLGFPTFHRLSKVYHIDGFGGELVRAYFDEDEETFVRNNCRRIRTLIPGDAGERCARSTESVLNGSFSRMREKLPASQFGAGLVRCLYQNTISANHHGKISWELYMTGVVSLSPLMDPDLQLLRLGDDVCADRNLLVAVLYRRFGPKLLEFPFESGRTIDAATLRHAEELNRRFPRTEAESGPGHAPAVSTTYERKGPQAKTRLRAAEVEACLKRIFLSDRARRTIGRHLGDDLYVYAVSDMSRREWRPQIEYHALLGCLRVLDEIALGPDVGTQTTDDWIASYLERRPAELPSVRMTVTGCRRIRIAVDVCTFLPAATAPKGAVLLVRVETAGGCVRLVRGLFYSERFASPFAYVPVSDRPQTWTKEIVMPEDAAVCELKLVAFSVPAESIRVLKVNVTEE